MSNDWTNKLRNQLADYQEPVSHDLWAEIEQSLAQSKKVGDEETDVKKRPQTRYVVLKRWSVAAAIALLGVGGSYVYLHDDEPGQANLLFSVLSLQHQVQTGLLLLSVQKHNRQEVKMLSCLLKTMHMHIR